MNPTPQRRKSLFSVRDRGLSWAVGVSLTFGMLLGGFLLGEPKAANAAIVPATCATGTADHTSVVESAINTAKVGDEVVVKGTCVISRTLLLKNGITFRGDGRDGARLVQKANAKLPVLVATDSWTKTGEDAKTSVNANVRVERLTIDGNIAQNAGATTVGLLIRAWDSRVYDVGVYNAGGDGIRVTTVTKDGTVLRNQSATENESTHTMVNSIIADSYVENSGANGIRVEDPENGATDWIVERNWIAKSKLNGVLAENGAGWQFRNNHVYGVGLTAIDVDRCFNTGINDNYIEDFGGEGKAGQWYYGIHCGLQPDVASVITGNRINRYLEENATTLPPGTYLYIGAEIGNGKGTGFVNVTGNTAVGAGAKSGSSLQYGLGYFAGTGSTLNVLSANNLVTGVDTAKYTENNANVKAVTGV